MLSLTIKPGHIFTVGPAKILIKSATKGQVHVSVWAPPEWVIMRDNARVQEPRARSFGGAARRGSPGISAPPPTTTAGSSASLPASTASSATRDPLSSEPE